MTHQYSRAEQLLTRPFPTTPPKPPNHLKPSTNGHPSSMKGKFREQDELQPRPASPRLPAGPGGMIEVPEEMQDRVSRLVDMSVACRYLAAQCQVYLIRRVLKFRFDSNRRFGKVIGLQRLKC
jgi:anaphase-promoting complex subunit 6